MAPTSNQVDNFKDAILEVWQRDGKTTWPIDLNSVSHLFIGDFDKELLEDIQALQKEGLTSNEICQLFVIPQRIIRLIMPFVQGMGALGLSRDKRTEHVKYLLSLVEELKYGDPSNRDGRNIVLSPEESSVVTDESRLSLPDAQSSRLVHLLCGVLWAYAETLFFKTHGFVREFHGPYLRPGEDREYLVRDFVCLKPVELWDDCSKLRYSKVRIVTAYDQLNLSVDIYNHVSIPKEKNYVESLQSYYVECDGKLLSSPEIEQLHRELTEVMLNINKKVESMSWQMCAEKYAEIFWYCKKNLRDRLGVDWTVPDVIRRNIRAGELKAKHKEMSERELRVLLRLSF
jgi:hypothetical protein